MLIFAANSLAQLSKKTERKVKRRTKRFHPMLPAIAIITPNTLAAIGLSGIVHRMMPGAEAVICSSFADLVSDRRANDFFHYFISADEMLKGSAWFLARQHKTIVLLYGEESGHLPQGFHTLNVCQSETQLVRDIVSLAHHAHTARGAMPDPVRRAARPKGMVAPAMPRLTPREREVLQGIVSGLINKEIAARMGVSLATVITHRKNLTEKIGTRSVSALTIFAVAHGIVRSEDI